MVRVMLDDIRYIEGMKNYIKIVVGTGTVITKNSMAIGRVEVPIGKLYRAQVLKGLE